MDNDFPQDFHVVLIIVGALAILWLFGIKLFAGVRV